MNLELVTDHETYGRVVAGMLELKLEIRLKALALYIALMCHQHGPERKASVRYAELMRWTNLEIFVWDALKTLERAQLLAVVEVDQAEQAEDSMVLIQWLYPGEVTDAECS